MRYTNAQGEYVQGATRPQLTSIDDGRTLTHPITMEVALEEFLMDCRARRLTAHTLRGYRGKLSLFMRWCAKHAICRLDELTHRHVRQYLIDLAESGVSSAYQYGLAKDIRAFLNYCVRDDFIHTSPFNKVRMPRLEKKVPHALSNSQIERILNAATTERDKAIVLFLFDTGVRASELCSIDVNDIDLELGEILIRHGKGQKQRFVYIGQKAQAQLEQYFATERKHHKAKEPLFLRERAPGRLTYHGLKQLLRRLKDATGINCHAHTFRRTFAINCLRNGMDIYMLAKLMGHTDIIVLRAYLQITEDDLRAAHRQFGPVDHWTR